MFHAYPNYDSQGAWYDWAIVKWENPCISVVHPIFETEFEESFFPCKLLGFFQMQRHNNKESASNSSPHVRRFWCKECQCRCVISFWAPLWSSVFFCFPQPMQQTSKERIVECTVPAKKDRDCTTRTGREGRWQQQPRATRDQRLFSLEFKSGRARSLGRTPNGLFGFNPTVTNKMEQDFAAQTSI